MRRTLSSAALSICMLLVGASTALADNASHDPKDIGGALKGLVMPNARDLWLVGLVVGVLGAALARRGSKAAGILFVLAGAGLVIFNAGGAQEMMSNIAHSIL